MFSQLLLLPAFTVIYLSEVRIIKKKEIVNGKVFFKLKLADGK